MVPGKDLELQVFAKAMGK
jgi:hypothetical protein